QKQPPRKRALLYRLGGLGLVLCLGSFWEMRGAILPPHHLTQHANVSITRTVHSTKPNTRQNGARKPASVPVATIPDPSQPIVNPVTIQATHPQQLVAAGTPVTASSPTISHAPTPTIAASTTPTPNPTPSASPSPTGTTHQGPLTVQIVNAPA